MRRVTMTLSNTIVITSSAIPATSDVTNATRQPVPGARPAARARRAATMPATTATTATTAKNGSARSA